MSLKLADKDIWFWYQHIVTQKASEVTAPTYCTEHGLDYKKFTNMRYRMFSTQQSRPEEYDKMVALARKFMASGLSISAFCTKHKVDKVKLTEINTHVKYHDVIDRLKKENQKPSDTMHFIALDPKASTTMPSQQYLNQFAPPAEVVEARNDIELVITKGVKVMISPQVDSMKIIKIIELLKDL